MTKEEEQKILDERLATIRKQALIAKKTPEITEQKDRQFTLEQLQQGERLGKQRAMGYGELAEDAIRSGVSGVAEGIVSTPGGPFDIYRLGQIGRAYTDSKGWTPFADTKKYEGKPFSEVLTQQDLEREQGVKDPYISPETVKKWGGEAWIDTAKKAAPGTSLDYESKTPTGDAFRAGGNIVGGAATGDIPLALEAGVASGGRAAARQISRSLKTGAGTGAVVGGVDYATEGSPGWKLAAGVVAGPLARMYGTKGADQALRESVGSGSRIQPNEVRQADNLVERARDHGLALSRLNAVDFVTGGRAQGLSELQRIIESASPEMLRFFADNAPPGPSRVRAAVERQLNTISPGASQNPATIGPRVAETATRAIAGERAAVNEGVRSGPGGYASFETAPVDPAITQAMMADPHWAATANRLANDTQYASFVQQTPPGTVGFMQLVNQQIANERRELTQGTGRLDPQAAEGIRPSQESGEAAASMASRQLPPGQGVPPGAPPSPLDASNQQRAVLQERVIDPLEQGPLGGMSRADTTQGVHGVLGERALEGSGAPLGRAVRTIAQDDPDLANEMVRNYIGTVFEQTTTPNIAGEPYTAGTKFWKTIAGGQASQEREGLQEMMTALPNGQAVWEGFEELGRIFEAQGKRQAPGSKTAFNEPALKKLSEGGTADTALMLLGTNLSALGDRAKAAIERFRLGNNMEEIRRLATDPGARQEFAHIMSTTGPNSAERTARLLSLISATGTAEAARPVVEDPRTEQPLTFSVSPGARQ